MNTPISHINDRGDPDADAQRAIVPAETGLESTNGPQVVQDGYLDTKNAIHLNSVRQTTCALCGEPLTVEWIDQTECDYAAPSQVRVNLSFEEILRTRVVHDECLIRHDADRIANLRRFHAAQCRQTCVETGLIPKDALECQLSKSNPDVENRDTGHRNAYAWLRAWIPTQMHPSAWVQGGRGTGKSFFGRCWYQRAIDQTGLDAAEVQAEDLHRAAIAWVDGQKLIRRWERVGALMIDDVSIPTWRQDSVTGLRQIIDYRYRNRLPTLVTSNLSVEDQAKLWQQVCSNVSIVNTMTDRMRPFHRVSLLGDSLRQLEFI